jgi:hypothetical protein
MIFSVFLPRNIIQALSFCTFSFRVTCVSIWENWLNLLSSTRFNQVMSEIHVGLTSTELRSRAAPPGDTNSHHLQHSVNDLYR